jgi:hypothetical protein
MIPSSVVDELCSNCDPKDGLNMLNRLLETSGRQDEGLVNTILRYLYDQYAKGRTDEQAALAIQAIYKVSKRSKGYYKSPWKVPANPVKNANFYVSEIQQENPDFFQQSIRNK